MVILRPLIESDSPHLFGWAMDRDTRIKSGPFVSVSENDHHAWFKGATNSTPCSNHFVFAICLTQDEPPIGMCQLVSIDWISRLAEVRIRIADETKRGQGHGRAALEWLIEHAFRDLNLRRLELAVYADNTAAIALYEGLGFLVDGKAVASRFVDGRYKDLIYMSMVRA